MSRKNVMWLLALALGVGVAAGSWATAKTSHSVVGRVGMTVDVSNAGEAVGSQVSFLNGFVPVAKKVLPAVVNIASTKIIRSPDTGPPSPFFSDPFFRQFFGNQFWQHYQTPRSEREHSLGSGVIVSADGYILTNNHVVAGANEIQVALSDERQFTGKIVGTDAKTDVAVVKIPANNLPILTLGDSSKVQVGEFALAVGNPFGLGETLTMGIISATGRGGLGLEDYEDFLQTDAAINPGNSGGALVNVRGELVGLNTAIVSGGGGGNQGVGFAVPVNMAKAVMDQIIEHGKVTRGWMGVVIQEVTPQLAKSFGLSGEPRGALVANITPGSPAEKAGIKRGDIILDLNGNAVPNSRDLSLKLSMTAPGTLVRLKVLRNGKEVSIPVSLGQEPASPQAASAAAPPASGPKLGISITPLTPDMAQQLGLPAVTKGIAITGVDDGSPAQDAGLQRGDVIQEVNHKPVTSVDQFQNDLARNGNQDLLLLIDRASEHLYVVVQPR
ncbi:MAG TPA: DegQ family serine endoprotease [Bryobacteraceae bacterium]|nr:DegQ family serine endoprotease [Bryobacteraceae bacterium]